MTIPERWKAFTETEVEILFEAIRDLMSSKDRGPQLNSLYLELHDVAGELRGWTTAPLVNAAL